MLGPSGCGKTTSPADDRRLRGADIGRVLIAGEDVTLVPAKQRAVNMVFQDYALFPHMTVAENVAFGLKLKKVGKAELRERVAETLNSMQLAGYESRAARPSSPAVSASASRSPGRSSTGPPRCCSTSRSARST